MKKMGDLMKDLGFRPEASDEVKKAFIENLLAGLNPDVRARSLKDQTDSAKPGRPPEQMSLFETEPSHPRPRRPKVG